MEKADLSQTASGDRKWRLIRLFRKAEKEHKCN